MEQGNNPVIAFNAHLFSGTASYRSAGISVYIVQLLRNLGPHLHDMELHVLAGDGRLPEDLMMPVHYARRSTAAPWRRIAWEQTALPGVLRRLHARLLHVPAFVGPLFTSCPQVVTIHDLSFLRHPEFFRPANRLYLRTMTRLTCKRARLVLAVSHFTAREVRQWLRLPDERVIPVPNGIDARFRPLPSKEVAAFVERKGLPQRFVLFMGTLEPRKNLVTLIRAFARLKDPSLHLVLAGARGWYYEEIFREIERLGLEERVLCPGFVPASEQVLWYNAARVFAYVSLYEGFGLPALEAMACGTPTVASATTSLPEVCGEGALLVPPQDEVALAEALHRLATDETLRHDLRARGIAQAARFPWSETARKTAAAYRQALHE